MECMLRHSRGCPISQHMLGCGKRQHMLAYEVACTAVLGERPRLPVASIVCIHGILPRLPLLLLESCGPHGLVRRGGVKACRQSEWQPCSGGGGGGGGSRGGRRHAWCAVLPSLKSMQWHAWLQRAREGAARRGPAGTSGGTHAAASPWPHSIEQDVDHQLTAKHRLPPAYRPHANCQLGQSLCAEYEFLQPLPSMSVDHDRRSAELPTRL